jgi:hypothetical protein
MSISKEIKSSRPLREPSKKEKPNKRKRKKKRLKQRAARFLLAQFQVPNLRVNLNSSQRSVAAELITNSNGQETTRNS